MSGFEEWWKEEVDWELLQSTYHTAEAAYLAATERAAGMLEESCLLKERYGTSENCSCAWCIKAEKIREG